MAYVLRRMPRILAIHNPSQSMAFLRVITRYPQSCFGNYRFAESGA